MKILRKILMLLLGLAALFYYFYTYTPDTIIRYHGFTVSYNPDYCIPNWVEYELTANETDGPYTREGVSFRPDETLDVRQAKDSDYRNSGWSRGHMAPAADFKWSEDAMWDTFHFTNCCPQNQALNAGQWSTLEEKVRAWADKFGSVSVVTGPIVGDNINGTIGESRVVVPDAFFKAICSGDQAIAFVMYNRKKNENMQKCAISVDSLEELTGYDFFSDLEDGLEERIEASYTLKHWGL